MGWLTWGESDNFFGLYEVIVRIFFWVWGNFDWFFEVMFEVINENYSYDFRSRSINMLRKNDFLDPPKINFFCLTCYKIPNSPLPPKKANVLSKRPLNKIIFYLVNFVNIENKSKVDPATSNSKNLNQWEIIIPSIFRLK